MNVPLENLIARAGTALNSMYDATEAIAALRVTRRSDDGLVLVTVDGAGTLIGLELAEDLSRESAARLAATVVTTASDAARDALERRAAILDQMQSSLSET